MKKITFVGFLMFVMLFGMIIGQAFGQSLDLPAGGQLKIMGAKEVISRNMFVDIPEGKKCVAVDILVDNINGKSDIKFGLWNNKLVFRDLDGYIYEQNIMYVSLVDHYFDEYIAILKGDIYRSWYVIIAILKGDIYRSWYVILVPTNLSINDLSVRFEDTNKKNYSNWLRIKI